MYEMIYISISTKRTTLFNVCTYLIGLHRSWTDLHECNALRDLVPYVQFKNTHGGVLLFVKLYALL